MADDRPLKFMIKVYVDDYINLTSARSKRGLDHILNTMMHGMHSVLPSNKVDNNDSISKTMMIKKDDQ